MRREMWYLEKNVRKRRTKGNLADEMLLISVFWTVAVNTDIELSASAMLQLVSASITACNHVPLIMHRS